MSLCAGANYRELAARASKVSSYRRDTYKHCQRTKVFHGDLLVLGWQQLNTRVSCQLTRVVASVGTFVRDGLECGGTVSSDKKLSVIKEPSSTAAAASWSFIYERALAAEELQHQQQNEEEEDEEGLALVKLPAAKSIVQLLSAWDTLSERLTPELLRCSGSRLLLAALKLSVPAFQRDPYFEDGRLQLSRALEVAYTLADLHMDAETIAAGILRVASDTNSGFSVDALQRELGSGTLHLLHNSLRVNHLSRCLDSIDDENAGLLRQFSLACHDVRAIVIELSARLDSMRHSSSLPKHRQQALALENMQVYAPLAHALGLGSLSHELEDMAFRVLLPESYDDVENWLRSHWGDGEVIISDSIRLLQEALENDVHLQGMVSSVNITGRCKSRFSTMKKLLKDGRRPEQVFDILGLRVILFPKNGAEEVVGVEACYRAQAVVTKLWKEVPGRMKDYIARPKKNGYSSLHLAIYLTDHGPWSLPLEVQIRTSAMHAHAVAGAASHALYKGGLTDPRQVQQFKAIMLAAAKAAAVRLEESPASTDTDHVFRMFDKNNDGVISPEEFQDVFLELGADNSDSCEMLKLLDANNDGAVNAQELEELKRQVRLSREFVADSQCSQHRKIDDKKNKCGQKHGLQNFDTIQLSVC